MGIWMKCDRIHPGWPIHKLIVVDSSAWVELLRATGSPTHLMLRHLITEDSELAVTEIVVMEILAGARSEANLGELRSRLLAFPVLSQQGLSGYEDAAEIYRHCRRSGVTIRKLTDCLIAVPAIKAGAALLHNDADFDQIARHTALQIVPVP